MYLQLYMHTQWQNLHWTIWQRSVLRYGTRRLPTYFIQYGTYIVWIQLRSKIQVIYNFGTVGRYGTYPTYLEKGKHWCQIINYGTGTYTKVPI